MLKKTIYVALIAIGIAGWVLYACTAEQFLYCY